MMKQFLLYLILVLNVAHAQSYPFLKYNEYQNDSVELRKRAVSLMKTQEKLLSKHLSNTSNKRIGIDYNDMKIYPVYWLGFSGSLRKIDFLDGSFLSKLYVTYYSIENRKYLNTFKLLCEANGMLVASCDSHSAYFSSSYPNEWNVELFKLFKADSIERAFYISGTDIGCIFALKKGDAYVLTHTKNGMKKYKIPDFINCRWKDFALGSDFKE